MSTAIALPEDVAERVDSWPTRAKSIEVSTPGEYERAANLLLDIKALLGEVAASCNPVAEAAYKAHRAACDQRTKHQEPLLAAEKIINERMCGFLLAERQRQREEEARRLAEARRLDEERRLREAEALEAAGEKDAAAAVLDEEPAPPPAPAPPAQPKVRGITVRETWKAVVTDKMALIKGVAEGKVPMAVLDVNQTVLNQQARALKKELAYPGVRATSEPSIAGSKRS